MKKEKLLLALAGALLVGLFVASSLGRLALTLVWMILPERKPDNGYLSPFRCDMTTNGVYCFSLPPGTKLFDANRTDYRNLGYVAPEDTFDNLYKVYIVLDPETVHSMIRLSDHSKVMTHPGPELSEFRGSPCQEDKLRFAERHP